MKKLTVQGLKDYKTCARLYDYRYEDKEYEALDQQKLLKIKYNNTIKRVMYFFFYKKMGGNIPSFNALINRWEKLWFKNIDIYEIEGGTVKTGSRYDSHITLNTEATAVLLRFYERWQDDPGIPISIATNIVTPINDDIYIDDMLDLVLRYKSRKGHLYQVIKFHTDIPRPNPANYILDFANLRANFEHRNNEKISTDDQVEYVLYELGSERREDRFINMNVQEEDVVNLHYWALQIFNDEVFPSRRGLTIACKGCPFDEPCAKWDDWYGKRRLGTSV